MVMTELKKYILKDNFLIHEFRRGACIKNHDNASFSGSFININFHGTSPILTWRDADEERMSSFIICERSFICMTQSV